MLLSNRFACARYGCVHIRSKLEDVWPFYPVANTMDFYSVCNFTFIGVFHSAGETTSGTFFFQIILLISRIGALLIGWAVGSPEWAIGLFSMASFICWIGYLMWILNLARIPPLLIGAKLVFREIVVNVLFCFPLLLLKSFVQNPIWLLLGALVVLLLAARRFVSQSKGELNG